MAESKPVDHGSKAMDSKDHPAYDYSSFSKLLRSVMLGNPATLGLQGKYQMSQQVTLGSRKLEVSGAQLGVKVRDEGSLSVPQSAPGTLKPFSMLNHVAPGQVLDQINPDHDSNPHHAVRESPNKDGYHWRKYGQKQMKSSESTRSYYKCAHFNCQAKKKIRQCDQSGRIIEVVYVGDHNHDNPRKNCNASRGSGASPELAVDGHAADPSAEKADSLDGSVSLAEAGQSSMHIDESEQQSSSSSNGNAGEKVEDQSADEPESKQLMKEANGAESVTFLKSVKGPKVVVNAAADEGISSDGYRWRKYGQKMMKGNSLWRSYYRCTTAGCPVRKHVERVTLDAEIVTVTYQGKHIHDVPIPKRYHVPESPPPISSATAMNTNHNKKIKRVSSQGSPTKWSDMDLMSEKILELGGEKALESARTLLSIGIGREI